MPLHHSPNKAYICVSSPDLPHFHPAGWMTLSNSVFPKLRSFFLLRWPFFSNSVSVHSPTIFCVLRHCSRFTTSQLSPRVVMLSILWAWCLPFPLFFPVQAHTFSFLTEVPSSLPSTIHSTLLTFVTWTFHSSIQILLHVSDCSPCL